MVEVEIMQQYNCALTTRVSMRRDATYLGCCVYENSVRRSVAVRRERGEIGVVEDEGVGNFE